MKNIDLYRNYLAQTAIFSALDRAGSGVSVGDFSVGPGRIPIGWSEQLIEEALSKYSVIPWLEARLLIGFSLTTSAISMFAEGWNIDSPDSRAAAYRSIMRELPGDKVTLTDDDGSRFIAGMLHGQTYCIRVGVLPGKVGVTR